VKLRNNYDGLKEELEIPLLHHRQIVGYAWNKKTYETFKVYLYGYTGGLDKPYRVITRSGGTARFEHFDIEDPRLNNITKKDGE